MTHIAFSPDGALLALAGQEQAIVHDVNRGEKIAVIADYVGPIAFSPDGLVLATGAHEDSHVVKLWAANSGRELLQVLAPIDAL